MNSPDGAAADPKALRTLDPVFTLDLALPASAQPRPGARAWVRFDHGMEPLAWQWLRRVRQLFVGTLAGRTLAQWAPLRTEFLHACIAPALPPPPYPPKPPPPPPRLRSVMRSTLVRVGSGWR